jgi:hypothetical protein
MGLLDENNLLKWDSMFSNCKEVHEKLNIALVNEGFKIKCGWGKFAITDVPGYKIKVKYGKDCGFDDWGDVCSNAPVKIELFKK